MIAQSKTIQVGNVCIDGGDLRAQPICTLLAAFTQLELTGSLTLRKENTIKELCFRNGLIVASSSNHIDDSLGRLLLSWGQISQEIHDRLLQKADSPWRVREGERLLSWGVIDAITLNQAIHRQILFRIREVAAWGEGCYIFVPGQVKDQTPPIKVLEALRAAVEACHGENYLATKAARIFDIKPQRQFTSPFFPLVNRIPEFALFLSRVTGSIPFRGLVDFNNASHSWLRILILRELQCIEFPLPPESAAPPPQTEAAHSEEEPILLSLPPAEEAQLAYIRGKELLGQRNFAAAEKQFMQCIALAPGSADPLCRLAWSRILQNPLDLNIVESNMPLLEQAVRNSPANPDVHFFYGFALHLLGHDAVALCALERGLAIDPTMDDALAIVKSLRKRHAPLRKIAGISWKPA